MNNIKIAITSQNKREITGHAGKCRKFWIYDIAEGKIEGKNLLELPKEESFHESSGNNAHPLDNIQVLITGGMGMGLAQRLKVKNIDGIITSEKNPEDAINAYLTGNLERLAPHEHAHHHP